MTGIDVFKTLFVRDKYRLYECRACGTEVEGVESTCSECGNEDIAEFRLR